MPIFERRQYPNRGRFPVERPLNLLLRGARWVGVLGIVLLATSGIWAQPKPLAPQQGTTDGELQEDKEESSESLFHPPDRDLLRRVRAAETEIKEGKLGEAAQALLDLAHQLDQSEDYFLNHRSAAHRISMKRQIDTLLEDFPEEGKTLLAEQYARRAQADLDTSLQTGDGLQLALLARRMGFTEAGQQAKLLLMREALDTGDDSTASLLGAELQQETGSAKFEPLLSLWLAAAHRNLHEPDRAVAVLTKAAERFPHPTVRLRGEPWVWFQGESDALPWLDRQVVAVQRAADKADYWLLQRGNPAQTGNGRLQTPLYARQWRHDLFVFDNPAVEEQLEVQLAQMAAASRDQGTVDFNPRQALVVPGYALIRAQGQRLHAVDLASGKLAWTYPSQLIWDTPTGAAVEAGRAMQGHFNFDVKLNDLSSDGQTVFLLEPISPNSDASQSFRGPRARRVPGNPFADSDGPTQGNQLVAIDLQSQGKPLWTLGGTESDDSLTRSSFLGPPLPLGKSLYALVETAEQEIRLVAIDKQRGKILWSQGLVTPNLSYSRDTFRRSVSLTPCYAKGMLVCPTGAGAVVAVDLMTRQLAWGTEYARSGSEPTSWMPGNRALPANPNWSEHRIAIAADKVVFAPIEDRTLYVLDLRTGKPAWQLSRARDTTFTQVAAVLEDRILLVGPRQLAAFDLKDGKKVWSKDLTFDSGAGPCGRGVVAGDQFFQPLSFGQIWQIDAKGGTVVNKFQFPSGHSLGNLIAVGGQLLSVSPRYLDCFAEIDHIEQVATKTLQANPRASFAHLDAANVQRQRGDYQAALNHLREGLENAAEGARPVFKRQYFEVALDALEADFPKYRALADEARPLIANVSQRARYQRVVADGLEAAGETLAALQICLDLMAGGNDAESLDSDALEMEIVPGGYVVARSTWIMAKLQSLAAKANESQRAEIEQRLRQRLEEALEEGPTALRSFIACVGFSPLGMEARERLAEQLTSPGQRVERERLLSQLGERGDPRQQRFATARLALLYQELKASSLAVFAWKKLQGQWLQEECLPGLTGAQVLSEQLAPELKAMLADSNREMPTGQTSYFERIEDRPNVVEMKHGIPLEGPAGQPLSGGTLQLDAQHLHVMGRDLRGAELFRAQTITVPELYRRAPTFNRGTSNFPYQLNHARFDGQLVVAWIDGHLYGLSALPLPEASAPIVSEPSDDSDDEDELLGTKPLASSRATSRTLSPGVLWTHDLGMIGSLTINAESQSRNWGKSQWVGRDSRQNDVSGLGPVTSYGICVQTRGNELLCLDTFTGRPRWRRNFMFSAGSQIIGDDELLVILPPGQGRAHLVRTIDGTLLGHCDVPAAAQRMAVLGRELLIWNAEKGRPTVSRLDPATGKTRWSRVLEANSRGTLAEGQSLVVYDPSNQLTILSVETGEVRAEVPIRPLPRVKQIYAVPYNNLMLVMMSGDARSFARQGQQFPLEAPLLSGQLCAVNLTTGRLAWGPIEITQQSYWPSQPVTSPLLIFASHQPATNESNQKRFLSLTCIDKRNGRVAYRNESIEYGQELSAYQTTFDPTVPEVKVVLPVREVTVRFSSDPLVDVSSPEFKTGRRRDPPGEAGGETRSPAASPPASAEPPLTKEAER